MGCSASCAAVGLAWLEPGDKTAPNKRAQPAVTLDDIRAWLGEQDKGALVEMLMERVSNDDSFCRRLVMKTVQSTTKKRGTGHNLDAYRQAIDDAVATRGFVPYRQVDDYARGIEEAVDSVEELLKNGHAVEVIELTEHALAAVEDAIGSVDDSDGQMGGILERLQEIHHAACKKARPDSNALAKRLFEWELRTDWDTFFGAAERYADVLGEKGLAVYRTLAGAEWARVPALGPGRDEPDQYGKRFRITHIMETLARLTGDVEAVVAVMRRDLSSPYAYLEIAETYKKTRKHDLALEWAERGISAFPKRTDPRLRDFLAEEYHRRKRHEEAMALIWAGFTESPTLHEYQKLKSHADRIGQWPAWRGKALAAIREAITEAKRKTAENQWGWEARADHSELVQVFLWEKDIEAAWREAKEGGCSNSLWLQLAGIREKDHPEEALPVFQAQIEPTLAGKNNDAYREAVGLLRKVRALMIRLGHEADFARYLVSVRAAHKPKRNFMKLLERAKWK